jgi:hypothetical protein
MDELETHDEIDVAELLVVEGAGPMAGEVDAV